MSTNISSENVVQIIKIAEEVVGPILMALIKERVQLTEEQKAALDANYASYSDAIEESKESESTGRHRDENPEPEEGDTD